MFKRIASFTVALMLLSAPAGADYGVDAKVSDREFCFQQHNRVVAELSRVDMEFFEITQYAKLTGFLTKGEVDEVESWIRRLSYDIDYFFQRNYGYICVEAANFYLNETKRIWEYLDARSPRH